MGIIDFVKDAGESLRDGIQSTEAKASDAFAKRVKDLGLAVDGLKVQVEKGKAVLSGKATSQDDREKAVLAVGNTPGIERVDDQIEVAAPAPASQYHRVASGDTLSKIAKQYYGDAAKYPRIFQANQPMLKDPDEIYPGQVLRIPPQATAQGAKGTER